MEEIYDVLMENPSILKSITNKSSNDISTIAMLNNTHIKSLEQQLESLLISAGEE